MASQRKIRIAARLRHEGSSFQEIADIVGVASGSTVHKWADHEVWKDETKHLESIDRKEVAQKYKENLKKNQKNYERMSKAGLTAALKILGKISQLVEAIDIDEIFDGRDKVSSLKALVNAYDTLASGSKTLWEDATGLEHIANQLEENQPCPKP